MISKDDYRKFINDECIQDTMITIYEEEVNDGYFHRYRLWKRTNPDHIEMEVILYLRKEDCFRRLVSFSSEDRSYESLLQLCRKILYHLK